MFMVQGLCVRLIILFWLCAIVCCSSYYFILAMLLSVVHLIILFWLCYCRLFVDLRLLINAFKIFLNMIASFIIAN